MLLTNIEKLFHVEHQCGIVDELVGNFPDQLQLFLNDCFLEVCFNYTMLL